MSTAGDILSSLRPRPEDAKLTLDRVLKRYRIPNPNYGIPNLNSEEAARKKNLTLLTPKLKEANLSPTSVREGAGPTEKPSSQTKNTLLDSPLLNLERPSPLSKAEVATNRARTFLEEEFAREWASSSGTRSGVFHYLIRIAECALTLHCQVTAKNAEDARNSVARLPNLIECREISSGELAEIVRTEKHGRSRG